MHSSTFVERPYTVFEYWPVFLEPTSAKANLLEEPVCLVHGASVLRCASAEWQVYDSTQMRNTEQSFLPSAAFNNKVKITLLVKFANESYTCILGSQSLLNLHNRL